MIKVVVLGLLILLLSGCSQNEQVIIHKHSLVSVPESLLEPCKVVPVRLDYQTYETAFYASRDAYIDTAKEVAKCNVRLNKAREFQKSEKDRLSD